MNYGRELPWMMAVALCAATAVGVGAYALGSGTISGFQIAVALVALALGQVLLFTRLTQRNATIERDQRRIVAETAALMRETREERRVAAELSAQVSVLRSENQSFNKALAMGLGELRESYATIATDVRALLARQTVQALRPSNQAQQRNGERQAQGFAQQPEPEAAPAEPIDLDPSPYAESLLLALEPVVDMFSGQTAHYRMSYGMGSEAGGEVSQDMLTHHADRADLRPGLDLHIVRETLALLKRLRQRDPALNIFMPIGPATLASKQALAQLIVLRNTDLEIGKGLVIDLPHAMLASLPDACLEGLAHLARAGVEMSLSNASVAGLDLSALGKLNVRYIGINSAAVGTEPKKSQGIAGFAQAARAMHIQVIITGVGSQIQASQLMRVARFASGPAFAEPRRVRRDAILASQDEFNAAAE